MIIDIFSRYVVGWMVSPAETGELAEAFIADTLATHGIEPESAHLARRPGDVDDVEAGRSAARRSRCRPQPQPPPRRPTTTRTRRPTSRPSSTARRSPAGSARSKTPARSAWRSSITTTTSTATPASGCTPRRRCTTAPPVEIRAQRAVTLDAAYAANPARFGHRRPTTAETAHRRLDQRTHPRSTHQIRMTSCLTGLDRFRTGRRPGHVQS